MTHEEMLKQLESVRENSADMARGGDDTGIWQRDVEALEMALNILRGQQVSRTNADRIRAMSDEELANLLTTGHGNFDCSVCKIGDQRKCDMECGERCLAWLQRPAEEDA